MENFSNDTKIRKKLRKNIVNLNTYIGRCMILINTLINSFLQKKLIDSFTVLEPFSTLKLIINNHLKLLM